MQRLLCSVSKVGIKITPTLQMGKLRLTDIKQLVRGHRTVTGRGEAGAQIQVCLYPQILLGGDHGWLSWALRSPTRALARRRLW